MIKYILSFCLLIFLVCSLHSCQAVNPPISVDLDLPSGLLWATCNIGAEAPEEAGNYYSWGEIETKDTYSWSNYKFFKSDVGEDDIRFTKYVPQDDSDICGYNGFSDDKLTLDNEDDVARVCLGIVWRMPTQADFKELHDNCTWTWTSQNGVAGYLLTSTRNHKTLFLPAAGYRSESDISDAGSDGCYWSSDLYVSAPRLARGLFFGSDYVYPSSYIRKNEKYRMEK